MTMPAGFPELPDLPEGITRLPVDQGNGLPVPWSTPLLPSGRPDFSRNDQHKVWQAASGRLCGTCGQRIDVRVAFVGTAETVAGEIFLDPPMHLDCARAALTLCPHVARRGRVSTTDGQRYDVHAWMIWVTRDFRWGTAQGLVAFVPDAPVFIERYVYNRDGLLELDRVIR